MSNMRLFHHEAPTEAKVSVRDVDVTLVKINLAEKTVQELENKFPSAEKKEALGVLHSLFTSITKVTQLEKALDAKTESDENAAPPPSLKA